MRKALIILILLIFCLPIISAASDGVQLESFGEFDEGIDITLVQPCASCSYVNFTSISYEQTGQVIVSAVEATQNNTDFIYVVNKSLLVGRGNYIVRGNGDPDGVKTIFAAPFTVGLEPKSPDVIFYSILGSVLLGIILFVMGKAYNFYFFLFSAIAFSIGGVLMLVYDTGISSTFVNDGLAILMIGIGIFVLLGEFLAEVLPE